jgi:surfeit locus 1 family protein
MKRSKTLAAYLAGLALIAAFISLGFWQLDRAKSLRELQRPYQEQPMIDLSEVAQPSENLTDLAINRIVRFSGQYATQLIAPQQRDSDGKVENWLVGLMEIPRGEVEVIGRLFPRQFEDRSGKKEGELSRIDPALVSSLYPDALYDGFIIAEKEKVAGKEIVAERVSLDPARPSVPGFYWQHIAYVVIWWLMALVVLFLPFYGRWRKKQ